MKAPILPKIRFPGDMTNFDSMNNATINHSFDVDAVEAEAAFREF